MSDSLLADLQYIQLIAKEQHRRKRRLTRLKTSKRKKLLQETENSRSDEWHSRKHHSNKYRKAEWTVNIYLEYETKSIYNDAIVDDDEVGSSKTTTTTTTATATLIINDNDNDNCDQAARARADERISNIDITPNIRAFVAEQTSAQTVSNHDIEADDVQSASAPPSEIYVGAENETEGEGEEDDEDEEDDDDGELDDGEQEETLSSRFDAIEYDYYYSSVSTQHLDFPQKFVSHIVSLYESSTCNDINGLLNSARVWHHDLGQIVVIGSYLDELITIFQDVISDCPMDIIYCISELVGNAIIWLRKPGINIFRWSATSTVNITKHNVQNLNPYKLFKERQKNTNIRKWKFRYSHKTTSSHGDGDQEEEEKQDDVDDDKKNEFYFSGYIGNNTMKELLMLSENINNHQYLDLDWCFVVFLLLGLIPKNENEYFRWYFHQKLLCALPATYPW
eukprot:CAMPEP_0197036750 /NCGR_PEP_ID=MMETSP1384-20130603/14160_1 /TAXON_ID=29189 /ORGANISM="Ammonia sp." /LENGTH=450 /DNA_ID=CAMNT_0042466957 /DNA_START=27 /DNA_END=1376 /DNA_ORIENTATION=+